MASRIPEPHNLVPREMRSAWDGIFADIRGAESLRELNLYMNYATRAERDLRDFFTRLDTEVMLKLAEFAEHEGTITPLRGVDGE